MEQRHFSRIQKIAVIVNPASGGSEPPLRELNEALAPFESTIQVTQTADDGIRFCREAVSAGVDLIIVYGGDGTISQVLDGLGGSNIPLLVLRGGTGNLIADELDVPVGIPETLALFAHGGVWARPVDLGMINETTCFVLRCGCGLEVKALHETVHEGKSDWGKLAYAGGLWKAISGQESIDFRIWIDDASEPIEESGIALTVANAGRIGAGSLQISPTVSISDGLLDVCLIEKAALKTVMELISSNLSGGSTPATSLETPSLIRVQKARRIRVETIPPVEFQADGDIIGMTPFEIEVRPAAVWVVVPPPPEDEAV
jgi:YegS/Rv2252/BmrU family lipid kinase